MYAVKTPKNHSLMLTRLMKAWLKGQVVTVTYMKPEYDRPRVRTWHLADMWVSEDGQVLVLAWDSWYGEIRTFNLSRVTHYTVHRGTYSVLELSDDVAEAAEKLASTPEVDEDEERTVQDEWELAAAIEISKHDWFDARGIEHQAQRAWENAQFAWRMADAGRQPTQEEVK